MEVLDIQGAGGKGGGGHTPTEANDTLRARQNVNMLFAVNDGEIDSVTEIYLNRTPISQFTGATWDWRPGVSGQTVLPGFDEIESLAAGFNSTEIRNPTPVIVTFNYNVSAVRLTFQTPTLRKVNDDGDLVGYRVQLDIKTKATTASIEIFNKSTIKKGKASSAYSWDVRVERPANAVSGQSWQILVYRATANDANSKTNSQTFLSSVTELQHPTPALTYPGTALISVKLADASVFGNRVPEVTFKIKGRKIFLPTNYTPDTRAYDETTPWNLSFKIIREWTDNVVWHIYSTLSDLLKIASADIDITTFYNAAKYADQLIDNGKGGTEPRYTINNQFIQRENVPTYLTYLLTICNAKLTINSLGQISMIYDRPGQAVTKIAVNSNVVEGMFTYSSNDIEERFSLVNVTFNDPAKMGDTATATADDASLITRYGLQAADIVLAGCYSEAQAIRKGRWALWASAYDTEIISWSTFLAGLDYHEGDLVKIQDNKNFGFDYQGRILGYVTNSGVTTLNLDRSISLQSEAYNISFLATDGVSIVQKTISQQNGSYSVVSFTGTDAPLSESIYLLETVTKQPIIAKVISVKKDSDFYNITAIRHSESKYAYIDGSVTVSTPGTNFINANDLLVSAPFAIAVSENFSSNGVNSNSKLSVTWSWGTGSEKYKPSFQLLWRRDAQDWQTINDIRVNSFDISGPVPGEYDIVIFAINPLSNMKSAGANYTYLYRTVAAQSTLDPVLIAVVQGTSGATFATPDLVLDILHNPANNNKTDKLLDYLVSVWDSAGTVQFGSYFVVKPDSNLNALFKLSLIENRNLFGVTTRNFKLKIYCRDLTGRLSSSKVVNLSNPAPQVASFSLLQGVGLTVLRITPPANEFDVMGYKVYRSTTANFAKNSVTEVYDGPDTSPSIPGVQGQLYYFAVAAYDSFGNTGLNVSGEQSGSTLSLNPDQWSMSGIAFWSSGGTLYWTAGVITKNGTQNYYIESGYIINAWMAPPYYVFFNPSWSASVLQAHPSLSVAVSSGSYPLVYYAFHGNNGIKGGDGSVIVNGSQLIANSVGATQLIASEAVITTAIQIAAAIIQTAHIQDASIINAKIADLAVTYAKIADASVGTAKIGDLAVTNSKIAHLSVDNAKITDLAVSTFKIQDFAVTAPLLAYTDGVISINNSTWTTVQQATIYSTGQYCLLLYHQLGGVSLRIVRDGTVIHANPANSINDTLLYQDQPTPGQHTYQIQALGAASISPRNRAFFFLETKK